MHPIIVPYVAFYHPGLSNGARTVLVAICTYLPNSWPSEKHVAETLGKHENTVWNGIKELEQAGILRITKFKKGKKLFNHYHLNDPPFIPKPRAKRRKQPQRAVTRPTTAGCGVTNQVHIISDTSDSNGAIGPAGQISTPNIYVSRSSGKKYTSEEFNLALSRMTPTEYQLACRDVFIQ